MKELLSVEIAIIIAKNLKRLREKANLTQEEVAVRAGIHRVSYAKYETARQIVSVQNLVRIAYALNVTVDEILCGTLEAMKQENYQRRMQGE